MKTDYELFRVKGIPVSISLWFLLILPLTGFNLNHFISIFIAVLIHELAHGLTADKLGWGCYGINIGLFTGQAQISNNIHPRDNIKITAAGPLSNLILSGIGLLLGLEYFTFINIILFIFNILPIYPMDGGHILKDFLMLNMRNRRRGFEISMKISFMTSLLLLFFGIITGQIILSVFACVFGYYALKELGYIK